MRDPKPAPVPNPVRQRTKKPHAEIPPPAHLPPSARLPPTAIRPYAGAWRGLSPLGSIRTLFPRGSLRPSCGRRLSLLPFRSAPKMDLRQPEKASDEGLRTENPSGGQDTPGRGLTLNAVERHGAGTEPKCRGPQRPLSAAFAEGFTCRLSPQPWRSSSPGTYPARTSPRFGLARLSSLPKALGSQGSGCRSR